MEEAACGFVIKTSFTNSKLENAARRTRMKGERRDASKREREKGEEETREMC